VAYSCLLYSIIIEEINNTHPEDELDGSPCHQQALQPGKDKRTYIADKKGPQTHRTLK